jgi:hypothetical protein
MDWGSDRVLAAPRASVFGVCDERQPALRPMSLVTHLGQVPGISGTARSAATFRADPCISTEVPPNQGGRVVELLGERPQWPTPLPARSELPRGPDFPVTR